MFGPVFAVGWKEAQGDLLPQINIRRPLRRDCLLLSRSCATGEANKYPSKTDC